MVFAIFQPTQPILKIFYSLRNENLFIIFHVRLLSKMHNAFGSKVKKKKNILRLVGKLINDVLDHLLYNTCLFLTIFAV